MLLLSCTAFFINFVACNNKTKVGHLVCTVLYDLEYKFRIVKTDVLIFKVALLKQIDNGYLLFNMDFPTNPLNIEL